MENDSLQLECLLKNKGYPIPRFVWLKNGNIFSNMSIILIENLTSDQHLNNYTCLIQIEAIDEPLKINVNPNENYRAICCNTSYGPTFGYGCDIHVSNNANTTMNSYSNLGSSYKHPAYGFETKKVRTFNFRLKINRLKPLNFSPGPVI